MELFIRIALLAAALAATPAPAQTIYKTVNPDGTVVYSDKPPADGNNATVIGQKPHTPSQSSSPAVGSDHPTAAPAGPGQRFTPLNTKAQRATEIQRSAYGSGVPQAPGMFVRTQGPVEVVRMPDGSRQYKADGRVLMMEKKLENNPAWDDRVSPVPTACSQTTSEYDPKKDLAELSAALRAGRFADLESRLDALYLPVRNGHCSDRPLWLLFAAFDDSAEDLELRYGQWLSAYPQSASAHIARGSFWLARAAVARGSKYASETTEAQFAAMRALLAKAHDDLEAAQRIEPEHPIAAAKLVVVGRLALSREESRAQFERFRKMLPRSYALAISYATSLQIKWGGSVKELVAFGDDIAAHADLNPDFALMPSYAVCLLADDLRTLDRGDDAAKLKEKAALRYAGKLETVCYSKELVVRAERNRQLAEQEAGPVDATAGRLPEQKHAATFAEARDNLDRQLLTEHGDPDLYCRRAWYSNRAGKYDEARDFVARGAAINAQTPTCLREQSKLARLTKPRMAPVAIDALAAAVKEATRDEELHFELGRSLIDAGRLDAAEAQFTEAIALYDQFNGAWYWRGWVRARTGQATLALGDLDKAIEITAKQAKYWSERGHVHGLLKQYDEALADLAQAQRLHADDAVTQAYLAAVYEALGDCRRVDALRKVAEYCAGSACSTELRGAAAALASTQLRAACPAQSAVESQGSSSQGP